MIAEEIFSNNLQDYYNKLTKLQQKHHKHEYSLVHDELTSLLRNCNSYTEFGVKQGTTLAVAVLSEIKKIRGYDITLKWYNKTNHLFESYAKEKKIDLQVIEESSLECLLDEVDLLYIDDLHKYDQVCQELKLHNKKVNKYIVFHDTTLFPEIKTAIDEFLMNNTNWIIHKIDTRNVGFVTLKCTKKEK